MFRPKCPHCSNTDRTMMEQIQSDEWLCIVCSRIFGVPDDEEQKGGTSGEDIKGTPYDRRNAGRRNRI